MQPAGLFPILMSMYTSEIPYVANSSLSSGSMNFHSPSWLSALGGLNHLPLYPLPSKLLHPVFI